MQEKKNENWNRFQLLNKHEVFKFGSLRLSALFDKIVLISLLILVGRILIFSQTSPDFVLVENYSSSVNSISITTPTGYGSGDLLLVYIVTDDDGDISHPTDFIQLYDFTHNGSGPQTGLFYRLFDGSELPSYNFSFPSEPAVVTTMVYRNVNTSQPFDGMANITGSSNSPNAPSISTVSDGRTYLQFIAVDGASAGVLNFESTSANLIAAGESGSGGGNAEMMIVSELQETAGSSPVGVFSFANEEWTGISLGLNLFSIVADNITGISCSSSEFAVTYDLPGTSGVLELVSPDGMIVSSQSYSTQMGMLSFSFTPSLSGSYTIRDQSNPSIQTSALFFVDSDGDGFCDDMDADDDNDGILDIVESPECFNTSTGYESGDRQNIITVTTDFPFNDGELSELVDGNNNSTGNGIRRTNGDYDFGNNPGILWQFALSESIEYNSFTLFTEGPVYLDSDVFGTIQGSHDGLAWIDLTPTNALLMDDPNTIYTISLTQNIDAFSFYRMFCTSGRVDDDEWLSEITGTTNFIGSAMIASSSCLSEGVIPSFLNPDTDGDGCFDALEGGQDIMMGNVDGQGRLTGGVDDNGVPNIVNGGQGKGFSNNSNFFDFDCPCLDPTNIANNCDFDGDNVANGIDDDDDNDGILDSEECGDFGFLDMPGGSVNNTVTVCYNVGDFGINSGLATFADDKLLNPSNFGPSGIYKVSFNLIELNETEITLSNLVDLGCQIFHVGGESGLSGSNETALSDEQKQSLFEWSVLNPRNVVFAFQGMITAYTDHVGINGTDNPTVATVTGRGIFEGPFGTVAGFNQAGSYQGTFTAGNDPFCSIMMDQDGGIVGLVDVNTQDIFIADFGLYNEAGGLTNSANLSSASDFMFGNTYAFMAQYILEERSDICAYLNECLDDLDNDLFPNIVDVDADGDGCYDALEGEGGFNDTQISDGQLTGPIGPTGIPDLAGPTGQFVGQALDDALFDACSFDLSLSVTPNSITANKGELMEYTYTVSNESTNTVDDVQVRIVTPSNTEFLAATTSQGSYSNLTRIWDVGTVAPGDQTITITVTIK